MSNIPTQAEIDAIAHFVEAVQELHSAAFFTEEYRSLKISWKEGADKKDITAHFPDPEIVRSALVPFRRVWHQSEACFYQRIINILFRYEPFCRDFLSPILMTDKRSLVAQCPWIKDCGMSATQVINLWLNTRYHHVGKGNKGLYTRSDFDEMDEKLGPVLHEYFFLQSISEFSISLFNILQLAEKFLVLNIGRGIKPSFAFGPRLDKHVQRNTPGYTPPKETAEHRVWRLRRRSKFDGLNYLLDTSDLSDLIVAKLLEECITFDDFAKAAGLHFKEVDNFDDAIRTQSVTHASGAIDEHMTACRNGKCRRGFVAKHENGDYLYNEDYLQIIHDQFIDFRKAYISIPFQ